MHSSVQLFPALPEGVQGTFGRGLLDSPRHARRPPGGGAGPLRKRGIFLNTTANYQLSQWEGTDRILMEDFNHDNQKIDAALKAHADAVPCVKLQEFTVSSAARTYQMSLAGLDFSGYAGLRFVLEIGATSGSLGLRFNGLTGGYENYFTTSLNPDEDEMVYLSYGGIVQARVELRPFDGKVGYWVDSLHRNTRGSQAIWVRGVQAGVSYSQLASISLYCYDDSDRVPLGTTAVLYGLRY